MHAKRRVFGVQKMGKFLLEKFCVEKKKRKIYVKNVRNEKV